MHIPNADRALQVIHDSINEDGWLLNTVDPETFSTPSLPGSYSPEGQAFVVEMYAAWRDWSALGSPGKNGAAAAHVSVVAAVAALCAVLLLLS